MKRILANQKEPNTEISPTNDVTAEERGTGKEETELTRIQMMTNKSDENLREKRRNSRVVLQRSQEENSTTLGIRPDVAIRL